MRLFDWLLLLAFISSSLGLASFLKREKSEAQENNFCSKMTSLEYRPEIYLMCQKKIKVHAARASHFAMLDGISIKKARMLVDYIERNPITSMQQLLAIKGIGPKTLEHLSEYFEP